MYIHIPLEFKSWYRFELD